MISGPRHEQAVVVRVAVERSEDESVGLETRDTIFLSHARAVYAFAIRRVGSPEVAEDITAEVFLEAVRRWNKAAVRDPLPWLYGVARRKVADHLRKATRRPARPLSDELPAAEGDPHEALEVAELKRMVDALPPDQREALLLHYLEGLSAEQIGVAMGKTRVSVNSLLQRARQNLRVKTQVDEGTSE